MHQDHLLLASLVILAILLVAYYGSRCTRRHHGHGHGHGRGRCPCGCEVGCACSPSCGCRRSGACPP